MISRCGGREVGILEEDVIWVDQKYHDKQLFEVLKKNYQPYFRKRLDISPELDRALSRLNSGGNVLTQEEVNNLLASAAFIIDPYKGGRLTHRY